MANLACLTASDAGIETIVLDPGNEFEEEHYPTLVGDFLYELAGRVCAPNIPGTGDRPFVSKTLLRHATANAKRQSRMMARSRDMERLSQYRIPDQYLREVQELFSEQTSVTEGSVAAAMALLKDGKNTDEVDLFLLRSASSRAGMELQDLAEVDWGAMGKLDLEPAMRERMLSKCQDELRYHQRGFDAELFFATFLVMDIAEGKFGATEEDQGRAVELLGRVGERYPGVVEELRNKGRGRIEQVAESYNPGEEAGEEAGDWDEVAFE